MNEITKGTTDYLTYRTIIDSDVMDVPAQ